MRLRAEARARWRSWLGLALLAGVFGGAVIAAAEGAARTGSVVDRFIAATRPPDVFIAPQFISGSTEDPEAFEKAITFDNLRKLPSVVEAVRFVGFATGDEESEALAPTDPRFSIRTKVLEGRLPDPRRPDEATINFSTAEETGLAVGDRYTIQFLRDFPGAGAFEGPPQPGPKVTFTITGITAHIGDIAAIAAPKSFGLTWGFFEKYGSGMQGYDLLTLRLRRGPASYGDFDNEVEALSGGQTVLYIESGEWEEARRSFSLQSIALWILAGILALVTLLVVGQTIVRQTFLESSDHPVLRALGLGRGELLVLGIVRATLIGSVTAAIAVSVAAAASTFMPFGNARIVDLDAGFSVPLVSSVLGFVGVLVAVVALSVVPSWRAARTAAASLGPAELPASARPSVMAERVSKAARGPAAGVGVRMALEAGRGRTAVPVRTTISATAVGIVALVAALIVGASLSALRSTPRLFGWDWDVIVSASEGASSPQEELQGFASEETRSALLNIPGVEAASFGPLGGIISVDGVTTEPYGLFLDAAVHPPIIEGRPPTQPKEIAVARKTLRAAHKKIGDVVEIKFPGTEIKEGSRFRVVGVTVLPIVESDIATLGDGVWIPLEGVAPLFGGQVPMDGALVRFDPGADPKKVRAAILERFGDDAIDDPDPGPQTILNFGRVEGMPYILAGLVALLAVGTLTHGLVTAVRRRRRDLAVLKTLGLDRRQVRRAVAWQATTTSLITVLISIPLGVIVGRWVWTVFADQAGFVPAPIADSATIALIVPAALVAANLIAALPGRSAARTRPALILRTE